LQRLLVGWTRSRGAKLVPFSEKERTNVCSQTIRARLDARRASLPQTSSWTSAHTQGYFSATILMLVAFEQNMMNMENDDADAQFNQDVFGPDF
jgi:hypothetical protein